MLLSEDLFNDIVEIVPNMEAPTLETSEVELETPEQGPDTGIANLIHDLIIDEHEAIQGYNTAIANMETRPEFVNILKDIANEEMNHIGMLEKLLTEISSNAENIMNGAIEASQDLEVEPQVTEALNEDVENKFEVYNDANELLNSFSNGDDAIDWAIANEGDYVIDSTLECPPMPTNRVWERGFDEWVKCEWCEENTPASDLTKTDMGWLCDQCLDYLKSTGAVTIIHPTAVYNESLQEANHIVQWYGLDKDGNTKFVAMDEDKVKSYAKNHPEEGIVKIEKDTRTMFN